MRKIKQKTRRLTSFILGIILTFSLVLNSAVALAIEPQEETTIDSDLILYDGYFGTSYWRIENDGTLYIGEGELPLSTSLWYDYREIITKIVFEGEVVANSNSSYLFHNLSYVTSIEGIELLDTSNVRCMSHMFSYMHSLTELDVSNFDTTNVRDMSAMFVYMDNLTELDVSNFDTSKVQNMNWMFSYMYNLKELGLSNFDTSNVQSMEGMFVDMASLTELDVSNFDTSKVQNMAGMFMLMTSITELDLSNFDTSNVQSMEGMFAEAINLSKLDLSNFDTSKVQNMAGMFLSMPSLIELDLSNFDTGNVQDMEMMFFWTHSLTKLDLSSFDTSKVHNMNWMFSYMTSLTKLDLSNFDTSNVQSMDRMFIETNNLSKLILGENFSFIEDEYFIFNKTHLTEVPNNSTYTGFWQNIGEGTIDNPLGEYVLTTSELIDQYDGLTMADTYVWQRTPTYTVNLRISGEGQAQACTIKNINHGDTITLTAIETVGSSFKGWVVVSGDVILSSTTDLIVTFENNGQDVEIIAVFDNNELSELDLDLNEDLDEDIISINSLPNTGDKTNLFVLSGLFIVSLGIVILSIKRMVKLKENN
jgi:bacterial surface protein 26-residue repeat